MATNSVISMGDDSGASAMNETESLTTSVCSPIQHPNQPMTFNFPRCQFGKSSRPFQSQWFLKWKWLHYDEAKDAAFCFICMTAVKRGKMLALMQIQLLFPGATPIGNVPQVKRGPSTTICVVAAIN